MSHIPESPTKRRWQNTMSKFHFTVKHIKGSENVIADVLSRTTHNEPSSPSEGTYSPSPAPDPDHSTTTSYTQLHNYLSDPLPISTSAITMLPKRLSHLSGPPVVPTRYTTQNQNRNSEVPDLGEMWPTLPKKNQMACMPCTLQP